MTPTLEALQSAAKAGFDAPECLDCMGRGGFATPDGEGWHHCFTCHATGLDASDPERLIGRAMAWLQHKGATNTARRDDDWHAPPFKVDFTWPTCVGLPCSVTITEAHDGTLTGLAAAMLRLVARVGGGE